MKIDPDLIIGLLGIVVFIGTIWTDLPILVGAGLGFGFAGLVTLAVHFGAKLARKKKNRTTPPVTGHYRRRTPTGPVDVSGNG